MPLFTDSPPSQWGQALDHLKSALTILDETNAPETVAPHLDLAICRLEEAMGRDPAENSVPSLRDEIDEAFAAVMAEKAGDEPALIWA